MNINKKLLLVTIFIVGLYSTLLAQNSFEKTIYLMRAKQFYASGSKMNLMINEKLFYEIKNGTRLIIKSNSSDTLYFQIIYPLDKRYKSKVLVVLPDDKSEMYINLHCWGEGYNPLKHSGVLRGPNGEIPKFNIEIEELLQDSGKLKFWQSEFYKDNDKIIEKKI